MTDDLDAALDRLTQAQIDCLLLVYQHMTSKQIAPRLGVSSHTVDQRIRTALRILGCTSRAQAAQLVASRHLPTAMFQWHPPGPEPFVDYDVPRTHRRGVQLPFATKSHPTNEMSPSVRLLWIVTIAAVSALSAGVYLAGLESLARLLRGL
jgi:DNA-binding CsgD family transcriptional regulator